MLFLPSRNRRSLSTIRLTETAGRGSLPRVQALPTREDLDRWQSVYRPTRRVARETSLKSHSSSPVPLISLTKIRAGVRPGKPWFPTDSSLPLSHSFDLQHHHSDSFSRLFPAAMSSFDSVPVETDATQYAASARTAFQSDYLKMRKVRLRQAQPHTHPEYSLSDHHGKSRDRVVRYRESMLRLRHFVGGRQLLS